MVLAQHPEKGHGKAPAKRDGKGGKAQPGKEPIFGSLPSGSLRPRTVRLDCQIAENISQDVRDAVRGTKVAEKQTELLTPA